MLRTRLSLLVAISALLLTANLADAAPRPLLTDPKGDALALGASYDILSANLFTTGTTKKVGRKTVYTPVYMVATVTLAGPPSKQLGATVNLSADSSACRNGTFKWSYTPGSRLSNSNLFVTGCGEVARGNTVPTDFVDGSTAVVKGNTITWRFKLKVLGKDLPLGSTFRNIYAQSDINEPVFNLFGTSLLAPEGDIDYAETAAIYKLR